MKNELRKALNLFTLNNKRLENVKAGIVDETDCYCACAYADQGGSSFVDNANANIDNNLHSPG